MFEQYLVGRVIRDVAISVDEANDPLLIHDEEAGHLSHVPDGLSSQISASQRGETAPPHSKPEDLSGTACAQAVSRVGFPLRIGKAWERHRMVPTKGVRLHDVSLADEHDLRTLLLKPLSVASQPGDVFATEGSAVVTQENENNGPARPKIG